jgi:hypothetical protein
MKGLMIIGKTKNNENFRPSNWNSRLSSIMTLQLNHQYNHSPKGRKNIAEGFSPYVMPTFYNKETALFLDDNLRNVNPNIYNCVMKFAQENNLLIQEIDNESFLKN